MKRTGAIISAAALAATMALVGCKNQNYDVIECDKGDQIELDSDCGYWRNHQFVWYGWVTKGKVSTSPEGFEPIADDGTQPKHAKRKRK